MPHYCEIHVTVRDLDPTEETGYVSTEERWWFSKVSHADFDDPSAELIFTTRASTKSEALDMIRAFHARISGMGGKCVRSKVEEVTFDTKLGDAL